MVLKKTSKNRQRAKPDKGFKSKTVAIAGYYYIILFLILVLLDRFTKIWISTSGNKDHGWIAFTYALNTGAGFSILKDMNVLLTIISVSAIIAIVYFRKHIPKFSTLMIISGITGNLIDRIFNGGVIDFINLKFWPIFNVADSLIVIGTIFWIIDIIRSERDEYSNKKKR